jgi:Zn-dependent protease with chaperone function
MPFLLMIFLVFVCLLDPYPPPRGFDSPALSAVLTWLGMAGTAAYAFWVARQVRVPLRRDPSRREPVLRRYERGRFVHQMSLYLFYLLGLAVLGWGWAAEHFWRWGPTPLPGTELLVLAPFLVAQLLAWALFYDADRASHRAAQRLLDLDPLAPTWTEGERPALPPAFGSRASFVVFLARQRLGLVSIPLFLLIVQKELLRRLPEDWQQWQPAVNGIGIAALVAVFLTMPWIIRLVLGLRPLPPGPVRDRLLTTGRRLRFRCSNILLWNTRSGMANAFVVGIVPWVRYVVFTDRLVEEFSEDEIEAVFGHEVGHIRYRHMLYYFGFLTASMLVLFLGVQAFRLQDLVPADALGGLLILYDHQYLAAASMGLVLLSYIFVVFGFLSRRCERQADVFGCRAVSCHQAGCRDHEPGTALAPAGLGLCPTGIRTFIRALEKVALVNGISRDRPGFLQSWQHSTIARRVEFLQRIQADPALEARFQRRVALVKWALLLVVGTALVLLLTHPAVPKT